MPSLKEIYKQRGQEFGRVAKELNDKYSKYSYVRLAFFLVASAVVIYIWSQDYRLGIGSLAILFALFIVLYVGIRR